jgi:hypothetical protein
MAHNTYSVVNVSFIVAASKTHFEEQALVADTKQADRLTRLAGQ